jgi:putative holliday junction resolvase
MLGGAPPVKHRRIELPHQGAEAALHVVGSAVPRAAGIDLGSVRVGLAVADELGLMAHPRPHLDGKDLGRLVAALVRLAAAEDIHTFVIGLPRHMDGRESRGARRARELAQKLEAKGLVVELVDERLTTVEATGRLREAGFDARESRSRVDSAAAAILLQVWLDARRGTDA